MEKRWRMERGEVERRGKIIALLDFWPAGKGRRRGARMTNMLKQSGGGRRRKTGRRTEGRRRWGRLASTSLNSNTRKWKESVKEMQSWCELEQQDRERSG